VEGFLIPTHRADLLAEAIERLLEDPDLRTRMGRAARARAEDRFDERRVVATVVGATRRLLVRSGRLTPRAAADVRIRLARRPDASEMAALHRRSMPTGFLPRLGRRVLRQIHLAAIDDPDTIALVAERDGAFEGFATATSSARTFSRRFAIDRGVLAAALALPRLARLGSLRELREVAADRSGSPHLPDAELLSIAVEVDRRRQGVGRALERAVREGLAERGVSSFKVLVGADNVDAERFYAGCGYRRAEQAVADGVRNRVWVTTSGS
jgi:ribosomal protein S18 acetylase RimI-like enzyme